MTNLVAADQAQFLQEIMAQASNLPALLSLALTQQPVRSAAKATTLIGMGEGSSYHALCLAQPWLNHWLKCPVQVFKPLDWLALPSALDNAVIWLVSQSGETASLKCLPAELVSNAVAITNTPNSWLARHAADHWPLGLPVERSIPATGTMTASWLTLLLWGLRQINDSPHPAWADLRHASACAWLLDDTANLQEATCKFARQLTPGPCVLLGGSACSWALPEVALKLTETSAQLVLADRLEHFLHGPKASLSQHPQVIGWVTHDEDLRALSQLIQAIPGLPVALVNLGMAGFVEAASACHLDNRPVWQLPAPASLLETALMTLISGQLLSWANGVVSGTSPNHPQLTKCVAQL